MSHARPDTSASRIEQAAALLAQGRLVAMPTETVYGLAGDARNPDAVRAIFALKGRPADHPLIVHIGTVAEIAAWTVHVPPAAMELARAFWPGPLTLVLPAAPDVPRVVTGGLDTVALRMPAHPLALALLRRLGRGLAAPSANRYGRVSPTCARHVREEFGDGIAMVVDGGACTIGIESTIVDLSAGTARILRPGAITPEQIEHCLHAAVERQPAPGTRSPGLKASHYCPRARVVCTAPDQATAAAAHWLARGHRVCVLSPAACDQMHAGLVWLRVSDDASTLARQLYAKLRQADDLQADVIVAALPAAAGIGTAVRDRLRRAAGGGEEFRA
jgi:L-threonylcarbamoyladenylate synthase